MLPKMGSKVDLHLHCSKDCAGQLIIGLPTTIYILWYIWKGNYQIYGHIRCIYTVLANPNYTLLFLQVMVIIHGCF